MRPPIALRAALLAAALAPALSGASGCALLPGRHRSGAREVLDLNRAPLRKIERLPGITPSMAKAIVAGRPYTRADDLVERKILTEHELDRIRDQVTVAGEGR
jgi:DNA uptake protein ComE-like DNA-binding protein